MACFQSSSPKFIMKTSIAMSDENIKRWNHLYKKHLPGLAKARDKVQAKWPVYLDHCFARIILDNAIGKDRPWTEVIKSPAVKNMTDEQFTKAIHLAEDLSTGMADISLLNEQSLKLRGKKRKCDSTTDTPMKRLKNSDETISKYFASTAEAPIPSAKLDDDPNKQKKTSTTKSETGDKSSPYLVDVDMVVQLKRIANSKLTTFRKQALSLLCQVPRGRYSTYQAMSDFLSCSSHKTCARAVGSAMRNNPFAPEVPCHRILASDGSLGGFGGSWGEDGTFASEKHRLLSGEGVRFDSQGKVKGPVFRDFSKSSGFISSS